MKATTLLGLFLLFSKGLFAQILLTGTVTDNQGIPVGFTTITTLQPVTQYTFANENGLYTLTFPDSMLNKRIQLVFNMIGYFPDTINVELNNKKIVQNKILTEQILLESVVITSDNISGYAYGTTKIGKKGRKSKSPANGYTNTQSWSQVPITTAEEYHKSPENNFKFVNENPVTTMSIDVDNASYSNIRRYLNLGELPPTDAVRVEEMINYFSYQYPKPEEGQPYVVYTEEAPCPWNPEHRLLHVGFKGKTIEAENLPQTNFVFLIDVSGSMGDANKLQLVKSSMKLLVRNLRDEDRVAIVTYSSNVQVALQSTKCTHKDQILEVIDGLVASGSTAGAAGIQKAYDIAEKNFINSGNNRVILCTDGDFNVGVSSPEELEKLIMINRDKGIFLTCLGFGMGNLKDNKIELLADKGNGNYGYIDNIQEANKLLVETFGATMYTVAKDMKVQVEFNPAYAAAYRLIGYENRVLENEDFEDDAVDAGELGAGQTVTTLYEIIPAGSKDTLLKNAPKLKYQKTDLTNEALNGEMATIKVRYKEPNGDTSIEAAYPVKISGVAFENTSTDYQFSAAVALYGMLLEQSQYCGKGDVSQVIKIAEQAKGEDIDGYRAEFVRLVKATPFN